MRVFYDLMGHLDQNVVIVFNFSKLMLPLSFTDSMRGAGSFRIGAEKYWSGTEGAAGRVFYRDSSRELKSLLSTSCS